MIPIGDSEPVLIGKTGPLGPRERGMERFAHTAAPLGTLQRARSEYGLRMWRNGVRQGRAGQAFEFGETGRGRRDHRRFLAADRRGPRQDDQAVKTKLLTGSCLRILDQGLGPTRARSARNRPLEPPCTKARLAQGWAGLPGHTRRRRLTSTGTPALDVDAPCLVTHWADRNLCLSCDNCLLE